MTTHPVYSAFNEGVMPKIAVINKATVPLGVNLSALIAAMQVYVSAYIAPVWGCPATLIAANDFIPGYWAMMFLDDADQPNALAYHDLTPDGFPIMKVFVKTTLAAGALVAVSASHELAEALIDPAINDFRMGPSGRILLCAEICDPCEEVTFDVQGIPMSDFVYPSYFEGFRKPRSVRFDQCGMITEPFELLPGGYQTTFDGNAYNQVFGSEEKAERFALEDRRQHRSEIRKERHATA